jgi:hypothetical protein
MKKPVTENFAGLQLSLRGDLRMGRLSEALKPPGNRKKVADFQENFLRPSRAFNRLQDGLRFAPLACMESGNTSSEPRPQKLMDRVRSAIRLRHYSPRTEEAYVGWIRRFVIFHQKRHPTEMGHAEVRQFLTDLAEKHSVSASTQNQALNALVFLYGSTPIAAWKNGAVRSGEAAEKLAHRAD